MTTTDPFYLRTCSHCRWHVHKRATDELIGRVVKHRISTGWTWTSYVAVLGHGVRGPWVGDFDSQREAVDEVWLSRTM